MSPVLLSLCCSLRLTLSLLTLLLIIHLHRICSPPILLRLAHFARSFRYPNMSQTATAASSASSDFWKSKDVATKYSSAAHGITANPANALVRACFFLNEHGLSRMMY